MRHPRAGHDLVKRLMESIDSTAITEVEGQITAAESPTVAANGAHPRPPTRLIMLIRHGQTNFNVEGRLPGQLPGVVLTDEGRRQAHRAAVALAGMPLTAVLSSPLERARDTAEIVARGWGVSLELDPRLMDTDVRRWAGQKLDEVAKADPAWKAFLEKPTEPPPDVESLSAVQQRSVAVVDDILRRPELGNYIALVAHADIVKLIVAHFTNVPLHGARHLHIANASISALAFTGEEPAQLLAMNWTPAPGWLVPPLPKPEQAKGEADGHVDTNAPKSPEEPAAPVPEPTGI